MLSCPRRAARSRLKRLKIALDHQGESAVPEEAGPRRDSTWCGRCIRVHSATHEPARSSLLRLAAARPQPATILQTWLEAKCIEQLEKHQDRMPKLRHVGSTVVPGKPAADGREESGRLRQTWVLLAARRSGSPGFPSTYRVRAAYFLHARLISSDGGDLSS